MDPDAFMHFFDFVADKCLEPLHLFVDKSQLSSELLSASASFEHQGVLVVVDIGVALLQEHNGLSFDQ